MPKINFAVTFPGQGSQSIGMLAELATNYTAVLETFSEATSVLGYDVWQLTQQGPEEQLNQTEYTQPALLTAGVAVWRCLKKQLPYLPNFLAGHSLGEYTAFVCAEALSFADALKLVQLRGQLMQQAAPENVGAMAAIIGLTDEQIENLCQTISTTDHQVAPANFNATGQIVVAGHKAAVEQAIAAAKEQGAKLAKIIPVSVPSHSFFMLKIAPEFQAALADTAFALPKIPVIQNVDANIHNDVNKIKALLVEQLYTPLQWTNTLTFLAQQRIQLLLEAGPGKVLSGLAKRTQPQIKLLSIQNDRNLVELQQLFLTEV